VKTAANTSPNASYGFSAMRLVVCLPVPVVPQTLVSETSHSNDVVSETGIPNPGPESSPDDGALTSDSMLWVINRAVTRDNAIGVVMSEFYNSGSLEIIKVPIIADPVRRAWVEFGTGHSNCDVLPCVVAGGGRAGSDLNDVTSAQETRVTAGDALPSGIVETVFTVASEQRLLQSSTDLLDARVVFRSPRHADWTTARQLMHRP